MITHNNPSPDLWTKLQQETRPIVLYGMGDGAEKIIGVCESKGIPIAGIFASDDFVRGQSFHQWNVEKCSTLEERFPEFVVLIAFGTARPEVLKNIARIARRHETYAPDVPVVGGVLFDDTFYQSHQPEWEHVKNLWADETSRQLYQELIQFKLTGNLACLQRTCSREEMFAELFSWSKEEIYVDAGAYRGDTVEEFIQLTQGQYQRILALEPEKRNYKKLIQSMEMVPHVETYELGAWSKKENLFFTQNLGRGGKLATGAPNTQMDSIDHLLQGSPATYLKYDVEGAEREALLGSKKTIQTYHPKLLISAYHRSEDLFALPLLLEDIQPGYQLYLRRNPGVPAWDINILAVWEETL